MAKKIKKNAKVAGVALPRPVTSPYTSPTVSLQFGPDHQTYYLPEILLQKLENVPSRDPCTREIHLVDVDASTGHVLIHFLHTGLYETLNDGNGEDVHDSHSSLVRNEFQKAMLALEAAKKYGLPGLQELAQIELERRGKDMCLRDAGLAIKEEFMTGLPDQRAWLRDYVSKKVQWTFKHDPSALTALEFFERIESSTLTRLLAQIIVGLYSEKVEQLREKRTATAKISSAERNELPKRIAVSSNAWPASIEEFGAFDDSSAAWDPYNLGGDPGSVPEASTPPVLSSRIKVVKENGVLHPVKEHTESNAGNIQHHQPEIPLSSADQAFGHGGLAAAGLQQPREENVDSPPSTAMPMLPVDSLANELHPSESTAKEKELSEKSTSLSSKKKKKKSTLFPTQDSSKDPLAALSKMQEKKLEKKVEADAAAREGENVDTATVEEGVVETPHPEAEEAPLAQSQERDVAGSSSTAIGDEAKKLEAEPTLVSWDSTSLISKKKKKKSKMKTSYPLPESPAAPLPLMTPLPAAPPHATQLEVRLTRVIAEDATVAEIAPAAHKDPKEEVYPFAGFINSQARKLKVQLDREAQFKEETEQLRLEEEEAAAAAAEAEEAESKWIEEEEERMRLEEEERMRLEGEFAAAAAAAAVAAAEATEAELKRIKEDEVAAAAAEAEEYKEKNDDPWANWGGAFPTVSKKKKKGKKVERIRLEEEANAAVAGAEDAELKKPEETEATAAIAEAGMSALDATIEMGAKFDDDDCGLRLEHLSRNEGWQNCKPCELYMRKIAIKLHAVGLPSAHEFSTIN